MNKPIKGIEKNLQFSDSDELNLVQLKISEYLSRKQRQMELQLDIPDKPRTSQPNKFVFNLGRTPYQWQLEALHAWRNAGDRGIVKVVTGAGKTVMALQAMEEMFRQRPDLRVSIVVPTVVLMEQWYYELIASTNIALELIGRHGGGFEDKYAEGKRIIIWVINSAARLLKESLDQVAINMEHFLVVDECHRAGASEFRHIFDARRLCTLGLSATPDREDVELEDKDEDVGENEGRDLSLLEREIGKVIYELTFTQAVRDGIIPKFEIMNYAVDLNLQERARYDRLSRELHDLEETLKATGDFDRIQRRKKLSNQFIVFRAMSQRAKDGRIRQKAARYVGLASERRRLLYGAKNRSACFQNILEMELKIGAQIIVFHEIIGSINDLYNRLWRKLPVVLYHSELPDGMREDVLNLYWKREARVILSARALIEGYNVPSTDVGIILASSSSPRQRIQTMGRVLRCYPGKQLSRIYNIYVHDSADEYVFMRQSWDQIIGAGVISYARWRRLGVVEPLPGPPYTPMPGEEEIDSSQLVTGSKYPGRYDGEELSIDVQGRTFRLTPAGARQYATGTDIGKKVFELKGSAGTFRITPKQGYVLIRRPVENQDWQTIFVTRLLQPLQFQADIEDYIEYRYSQKFGGTLLREEGGVKYLDNKSASARQIINAIQCVPREHGWPLPSRFYLSLDTREVYIRDPEGNLTALCSLNESFEIPIRKEEH